MLLATLVTACSPPAPAGSSWGEAGSGTADAADIPARPGAREGRVTVRIGMLSPNMVSVIHHIAARTGAYAAAGLDIEARPFAAGQSAAGIEALIRGDLDVYIGAGAEVARANSQAVEGHRAPPLGVIGGGTPGITALVLHRRVPATSLADLAARRLVIGVSSPSSLHLAVFRAYLLERNLTALAERWHFMRLDPSDMVPALTTGQIDGFLHSEPATSLAVSSGVGYVLAASRRGDLGEKARLVPMSFVTANRRWVAANPEGATRLMKALHEAGKAYKAMPRPQGIALLSEWTKLDGAIVAQFYDWLDPRADLTADALKAWWELVAGGMRARGEISTTLTLADVFDLRYQASQ